MDNYNRYIIDLVLQSRIDSANGSTGSSSVEEPSANLQSSSDGSGWTIDKTYADLQALQAKGTLTSLAWHREDGTVVTVPLTSTGPVDGKDAFVFSTIITTADGSTFNAFILDEDNVLTYVTEDIGGGGGGGGVDTAFKVVGLKDGHPNVTSPSKKIIYLTKDSGSTATDPYTEWIYTTDNEWAIIGETSVDLSGYKTKQTAKTDPSASGTKSAFIATITQNENGEMTATKANLPQASTTAAGIVQLGSGATNAAPGNHTHTTEIASDSGSPTVNLEANTTYKLTAGGTSVVFKTPSAGASADEKVKATAKTDNVAYPLMAVASSSPTSGDATEAVYGASVTLNPSTNTIAANISGDAATASDVKAGSTLATTIGGKANKVTGATDGELAMLDSSGDLKKSDISFDGTTTTKFLSKKGTFEDVSVDVSGKADKVSNATEGDIATLDSNGNLVDSGVSTSDFATSAQGTKADSAIQGVSAGGTPLTPDANKIVDIPNAVATGASGATNGLMTADDKKKLSDLKVITVTSTSVTDGITTFNQYVHPTTAGNKHVPAGGSEYGILCYGGSSGMATWESDEVISVELNVPDSYYNPLGLPPYTVRIQMVDSSVDPTSQRGTWTRVQGTSDTWDCTYDSSNDWTALFYTNSDIKAILGANTEGIVTMTAMLFGCTNLESIALFDTSAVIKMDSMFINCEKLTTLPFYDTSSVTTMSAMFDNCIALASIPKFDTEHVTGMGNMLHGCSSLVHIPLFDTSSATSMNNMCDGCVNVETGALELYEQASTQSNPPAMHNDVFHNCGQNTELGRQALSQIPVSWGGTKE